MMACDMHNSAHTRIYSYFEYYSNLQKNVPPQTEGADINIMESRNCTEVSVLILQLLCFECNTQQLEQTKVDIINYCVAPYGSTLKESCSND